MNVYAFGRNICSPFVLPGLAVNGSQVGAEVFGEAIYVTEASADLDAISRTTGSYSLGTDGLKISVSEKLAFLCDRRGCEIRVEADPALSHEFVSSYLIANGIPAALWLQGERLLHAGAARLPGCKSAVLLAGDSGSGKSTVLAELVGAGAALAAEDVCTLRVGKDGVTTTGFAGQIQLRTDECDDDRVQMAVPHAQQLPFCAASAIVVLRRSDEAGEPVPRQLHGVEALQALLRHRHRPVVAKLLDREAGDLAIWAECSQLLSVYSWSPRLVQRAEWTRVLSGLCSSAADSGGLV